MPNLAIQRRRRQIGFALLLLQLNFTVRRLWVHPINNLRFEKGEYFVLYPDLRKYEDRFFNWFRMSTKKFNYLLKLIQRRIYRQNANYREAICTEEQLVIMLT